MADLAIVHLTDLHYPASGGDQADWVVSLERALKDVANDTTLEVKGLAVTGDLVDTPNEAGFAAVAGFLKKALCALELDPGRRWLVDGNHDYRRKGRAIIGYNKHGIEAGKDQTELYRHDRFIDPDFFVLGIDSARYGSLARGKFTSDETHRLENLRVDDEASHSRFRIALVHHNVLPLPRRPPHKGTRQTIRELLLGEEGFSLFRHGSALVHHLIEAHFDLVLHGHEHQWFAANVSYLDNLRRSTLAVLGGIDARNGFQLVRFCPNGDVLVERVTHRDSGFYNVHEKIRLQNYLDWKRALWGREARARGSVERCICECELDVHGDLRENISYEMITAGLHQPKGEFTVWASVDSPLGVVRINRAVNKYTGLGASEHDLDLANQTLKAASYTFGLGSELDDDRPHPGFEAEIKLLNTFAITSQEAEWRGMDKPAEFFYFRAKVPSERVIFSLKFPDHFRPSRVEVVVKTIPGEAGVVRKIKDEAEDAAETHHARRQLVYNKNTGVVFLNLQWVLQSHLYIVSWDLPRARPQRTEEIKGVRDLRQLLAAPPEKKRWLDDELRTVRDSFCRKLEAERECDVVDLALFGFDEKQRKIVIIAGTYSEDGPERSAALRWAEGIQGLVLRRGESTYYSSAEPYNRYFYRPLPGCPEETHMFCIPIPLPVRATESFSLPLAPTIPRVIAVLSSRGESVLQLLRDRQSFNEAGILLYGDITAVLEKVWTSGAKVVKETVQH